MPNAVDLRGRGETLGKYQPGYDKNFRLVANQVLFGQPVAGRRAFDLIRAVDYLATRRELAAGWFATRSTVSPDPVRGGSRTRNNIPPATSSPPVKLGPELRRRSTAGEWPCFGHHGVQYSETLAHRLAQGYTFHERHFMEPQPRPPTWTSS